MKAKASAIIFLLLVLTSCVSTPRPFDNISNTAKEFALALLSADVESAKLLSTPKQWDKIDEWVKTHQSISCQTAETNTARDILISPEFSGGSWFTSGKFDEQNGNWSVDIVYDCKTESINYCFEITGVNIEKANDKWQIIGWDSICEKNNDSDPCPSMCK